MSDADEDRLAGLEDQIAEQSEVTGHSTHRYLAAWLKESRRLTGVRFDALQHVVDGILEQATKTNGTLQEHDKRLDAQGERIAGLEHLNEMAKMLREQRKEWEKERAADETRRTGGRRWRIDATIALIVGMGLVLGTILGVLGPALGWWG